MAEFVGESEIGRWCGHVGDDCGGGVRVVGVGDGTRWQDAVESGDTVGCEERAEGEGKQETEEKFPVVVEEGLGAIEEDLCELAKSGEDCIEALLESWTLLDRRNVVGGDVLGCVAEMHSWHISQATLALIGEALGDVPRSQICGTRG